MSNRYLFRAKRIDNGDFVFGCPIKLNGIMFMAVVIECSEDMEDKFEWVKIDSETVGQWTGLTDKNGTKIFEGDLIISRRPCVEYQTHEGDNIINGSYTEPCGVMIEENECLVIFDSEQCFYMGECEEDSLPVPLPYLFHVWDKDSAVQNLDLVKNRDLFDFDYTQASEDWNVLFNESGFETEELFLEHLSGVTVTGSIHD